MSLIIKMDSIKEEKHLNRAVPYIMNEAKTGGLVHSNSGITADEILDTFKFTRENVRSRGNRVGYHYKFSFSKDESIAPQKAMAFIRDWIDEYLDEKYDYVCAVHKDRDHLHMHLIFNSYCRDGGKYRYEKGDWEKIIKPLTNKLAEKYHTGPLKDKDISLDYDTSKEAKKKWNDIIKKDIDSCIPLCKSYEEFKTKLIDDFGYQLREGVSREHGVYLSLTPPGKAKAVRSYQLGDDYMPVSIDRKIMGFKNDDFQKNYHPDDDENYKKIYIVRQVWYVSKINNFIPYKNLSTYQQYYVRKMLEARRLYRGTGASLQMKEQSYRALKGMSEDATFLCKMNVRTEQQLHRIIEDVVNDKKTTFGQFVQKLENKNKLIRKLKEIENPLYKRKDVKKR